jgi:hypothetical protein
MNTVVNAVIPHLDHLGVVVPIQVSQDPAIQPFRVEGVYTEDAAKQLAEVVALALRSSFGHRFSGPFHLKACVSYPDTDLESVPAKEEDVLSFPVAAAVLLAAGIIPNDLDQMSRTYFVGAIDKVGEAFMRGCDGLLARWVRQRHRETGERVRLVLPSPRKSSVLLDSQMTAMADLVLVDNLKSLPEALAAVCPPPERSLRTSFLHEKDMADICVIPPGSGKKVGLFPWVLRAAAVAVAGRHDVILSGHWGCGRVMLASRMASIFPPPLAGETDPLTGLSGEDLGWYLACLPFEARRQTGYRPSCTSPPTLEEYQDMLLRGKWNPVHRPLRAPHYTATKRAMYGRRERGLAHLGEVEAAAHGILLLDEADMFSKEVSGEGTASPTGKGSLPLAWDSWIADTRQDPDVRRSDRPLVVYTVTLDEVDPTFCSAPATATSPILVHMPADGPPAPDARDFGLRTSASIAEAVRQARKIIGHRAPGLPEADRDPVFAKEAEIALRFGRNKEMILSVAVSCMAMSGRTEMNVYDLREALYYCTGV